MRLAIALLLATTAEVRAEPQGWHAEIGALVGVGLEDWDYFDDGASFGGTAAIGYEYCQRRSITLGARYIRVTTNDNYEYARHASVLVGLRVATTQGPFLEPLVGVGHFLIEGRFGSETSGFGVVIGGRLGVAKWVTPRMRVAAAVVGSMSLGMEFSISDGSGPFDEYWVIGEVSAGVRF